MLLAITPEDLRSLAVPIAIVVFVISMLSMAPIRTLIFKGQAPPSETRYPISKKCPACYSRRYRSIEAETMISFTQDRICQECATRYTPPTPVWGSAIFVIAGLVMVGFALYSAATNRMAEISPGTSGLLFELTLGIGGVSVIAFGIQSFRTSRRERPD